MVKKNFWSRIYVITIFLLMYLPIIYLLIFSFNDAGNMQSFTGFTWRYYEQMFQDKRLLMIVMQTFLIAFLSSMLATIIGVSGALYIDMVRRHRRQNTLLSLNNVLMVSPDVIIGASFLILFTAIGAKLGFLTVLLSHMAFSIPIVVLMVLPKIQEMPQSMIDAALDLGATPTNILHKIVLPYLSPAIIMSYFMAFTYSLDDFAVTFFVTGNGFTTLSVEIYSRARQGISLEINALSTVLFFVSLLLVIGYYLMNRETDPQRRKR